jgi:hypothetical protein
VRFMTQSGPMNCFPACFFNVMRHFGIATTPDVSARLAVFEHGTQRGPVFAPEERVAEAYGASLQKLLSEWRWAQAHRNHTRREAHEAAPWADYLLEMGITIETRNGPIEHKVRVLTALARGSLGICDVWAPSEIAAQSESKHAVVVLGQSGNRLLIHDPQPNPGVSPSGAQKVGYVERDCGSNIEVDCDYFFGGEHGFMKPKPNPYQQDSGYRIVLVSGS